MHSSLFLVAHLPMVCPQPGLCLWGGGGGWVRRTAHPPSFEQRKYTKIFWEKKKKRRKKQTTALPLYIAKRNEKMLLLGDKSEVPFALPRGKCLALSPCPSLGSHLIKALHKGKRQRLEGPFLQEYPAHQLQGRRATALLLAGCHRFALCLRDLPSPQPLLWARSLPIPPHKAEGKMLPDSSIKAHLALPAN